MHAYLGVYTDLDMECVRPMDDISEKHSFIIGYEVSTVLYTIIRDCLIYSLC